MKKMRVLVLGGNGFIGKAVCRELQLRNNTVIVGTRSVSRQSNIEQRKICFQNARLRHWRETVLNCHLVINCVGILRERWRESYNEVHHEAVVQLVKVCKENHIPLVHVSVLGLYNPVKSRFLLSKRLGEQAIFTSSANWKIVRLSLLEGESGYGAKWFRKIAAWPIHLSPKNATGKVAPIHVRSAAKQIVDFALTENGVRLIEIGGTRHFSYPEYLRYLKGKKPFLHLQVPGLLARLVSHIFDLLHLTPFSYGHFELMQRDNVPGLHSIVKLPESQLAAPCRPLPKPS